MTSEIEKLMPIPNAPECDVAILRENVRKLGTSLPEDFIEFGRMYGAGHIQQGGYDIRIESPFSNEYFVFCETFREIYSDLRNGLGTESLDLGLYPEPNGLLPFGMSGTAYLTWRTIGSPDLWRVTYIYSYEEGQFYSYDVRFEEFVISLLRYDLILPDKEEHGDVSLPNIFIPD